MSHPIQAIRGMHDILPEHAPYWRLLEDRFRGLARAYGYEEIRFPMVEKTELFERSIGAVTDIVEKEMYSFTDRNGDGLTLRPEGTAGCVRACIENGLIHNQIQRLWYAGPMFRHERPQKGRYRQFFQLGVEAYGMPGPDIDAELILMSARLWRMLGIADLELQINSLGSPQARVAYRGELAAYFAAHETQLDEDSRRRLHTNPLRILDSKNPDLRAVIDGAPRITERLDAASANHFAGLRAALDEAGVAYRVNPCLVRGLDYYQRTVFEWVSGRLGAQATVCAGGRYDGLIEQLGGNPTPAAGFALGAERVLALLMEGGAEPAGERPQAYLIAVGEAAERQCLGLAERLREALPGLCLRVNCGGGSFKSQFKRADRSGAALALVLGGDEAAAGRIGIKYLRDDRPQEQVAQSALAERLRAIVCGIDET